MNSYKQKRNPFMSLFAASQHSKHSNTQERQHDGARSKKKGMEKAESWLNPF